jgi:hypothetical protein
MTSCIGSETWGLLTRVSPATAQCRVDNIDQTLADLRGKVRALLAEKRAAFAKEIQAMIDQQAQARNDLSEALDDSLDR